ncbi:hypothetical protein SERLADRAFT_394330, partial [Serpula lacrymans var. lacrymans S7.9]
RSSSYSHHLRLTPAFDNSISPDTHRHTLSASPSTNFLFTPADAYPVSRRPRPTKSSSASSSASSPSYPSTPRTPTKSASSPLLRAPHYHQPATSKSAPDTQHIRMRTFHHPPNYQSEDDEDTDVNPGEGTPIYTAWRSRTWSNSAGDLTRPSTRDPASRASPRPDNSSASEGNTVLPKRLNGTSAGLSTSLRAFVGSSWRGKTKSAHITTKAGQLGAGETETEADEPPRHLPTTRILPASAPLVPQSTLTSVLFEASRLLSVVPALVGAVVNIWSIWRPPRGIIHNSDSSPECQWDKWGRQTLPDRGDYFIAVLWAILTAAQCLALTTGLLRRWQAYYPPLPTLIRLLALQAICWPATHFTLNVLGSLGANADCFLDRSVSRGALELELDTILLRWTTVRPEVCWAVIGTTTCVSRSIQIWVTSNLVATPSRASSPSKPGYASKHTSSSSCTSEMSRRGGSNGSSNSRLNLNSGAGQGVGKGMIPPI